MAKMEFFKRRDVETERQKGQRRRVYVTAVANSCTTSKLVVIASGKTVH
jgi:hypothetical protein